MVIYYVLDNQIAEMEKLINYNMFTYRHFKISRNHHYYKMATINLELEKLASFIMLDDNILKTDERYETEIINKIRELNP